MHRQAKECNDAIIDLNLENKNESISNYDNFSIPQKNKLKILFELFYAMFLMANERDLPIENTYNEGFYLSINRGRVALPDVVSSHHMGLMKYFMPMPINDAAFRSTSALNRVADRNEFILNSLWVNDNFKRLVHPFSSSISGVMLITLKVLKFTSERCYLHLLQKLPNDLNNLKRSYVLCVQNKQLYYIKCDGKKRIKILHPDSILDRLKKYANVKENTYILSHHEIEKLINFPSSDRHERYLHKEKS